MAIVSFDTHAVIKRLKESGFSENQAETLTDTLRDRENIQFGELATKNDIATLKHEMEKQESRLRQEIAELKADITKSIVYALIAMTGIFAAIVKLF